MKMPEKIKKGLEHCAVGNCGWECPYFTKIDLPFGDEQGCDESLLPDSLAYIIDLESNDSQVKKTLSDNGFASLEAFLQAYNQVKKERDAAVADLYKMCGECACDTLCCNYCKYQEDDLQCHHDCKMYTKEWDWQWRGVCAENSKAKE